jgi:epoxyqueuosine reductase
MISTNAQELTRAALRQARSLGADLAGAADWRAVAAGPSQEIQPALAEWEGVGAGHPGRPPAPEHPGSPESLLVVGLAHPADRPELDWWRAHLPSRTQGNELLAEITAGLASWLQQEHGVKAWDLAYHVERGGVFLKDAAVLAGLGVVGRDNLFLCPEHGPRVRLRALAVEAPLAPGEPLDWDPCPGCDEPCRQACPQQALQGRALPPGAPAPARLPARDGAYERGLCNLQMEADIAQGRQVPRPGGGSPSKEVHYCRRCELACPAGRSR